MITLPDFRRSLLARVVLYCAASLAIAGCNKGDELGAPDIHFGQDTCHACGMIIEDDRYAAAVVTVTAGGDVERQLYDDAGEMLQSAPPAGAAAVRRYVRDADTRRWLDADKATLVKTRDLPTPMGSGVAAYANPATARAAIDAHGGHLVGAATAPSPATGR